MTPLVSVLVKHVQTDRADQPEGELVGDVLVDALMLRDNGYDGPASLAVDLEPHGIVVMGWTVKRWTGDRFMFWPGKTRVKDEELAHAERGVWVYEFHLAIR